MKKIIAVITSTVLVNLISLSAIAKVVKIDFPSEKIKMTMDILPSKKNEDPKNTYLEGLTDCPEQISSTANPVMRKCLKFHTQFPDEKWSYVPVQLITSFKPSSMYQSLEKVPTIQQDRKETFKWGTAFNWNTRTFGSSHYVFLKPRNKNYAIQMGPFAGMLLINYDLNLKNISWK